MRKLTPHKVTTQRFILWDEDELVGETIERPFDEDRDVSAPPLIEVDGKIYRLVTSTYVDSFWDGGLIYRPGQPIVPLKLR